MEIRNNSKEIFNKVDIQDNLSIRFQSSGFVDVYGTTAYKVLRAKE